MMISAAQGQTVDRWILADGVEHVEAVRHNRDVLPVSYTHLPLVTPNLVALGIMTMLSTWKNLMWPIIVNRSIEKMTLSAGLAMLIGEHTTYYEQVMAGAVISVLPMIIVFMIFQKQFVEGIAKTGVKG